MDYNHILQFMCVALVCFTKTWSMTTDGPQTTENPCEVMYGCLNGASCDEHGNCLCPLGFSGTKCTQSSIGELYLQTVAASNTNLTIATNFATETRDMMDNQISQSYSDIKTSVETVVSISSTIISMVSSDTELAEKSVVDLSQLAVHITEISTDVLKGIKVNTAQSQLIAENKLESVITSTESNLIQMLGIMLDKKNTNTRVQESTSITTEEVSVDVVKVTGRNLPVDYNTRHGSFSLPYFETFQDKRLNDNVTINVITYRESPYAYVANPEVAESSVIKITITNKDEVEEKVIEDSDDLATIGVSTGDLNSDLYFEDMTESSTDSGIYMSYVDTNRTGNAFLFEVKLKTLKICDIYCKYGTFPDADNYDIFIKTKGKSRIVERDPLNAKVAFKDQKVKLTIDAEQNKLKPIVLTASCEDDRHDDGTNRRKRSSGLSLVKHQVRVGTVTARVINNTYKNWTEYDGIKEFSVKSDKLQFNSQFFGTFSAGMFLFSPSEIDFSKIFLNFTTSLADSPYALASIVCLLFIFILLTLLLHRLDKRDDIMWSFLPLLDNQNMSSTVYYVVVETAVTSVRVITSSVYINIIGKKGSSGTRLLQDGIRQNFKRGTSSHFELKLDKSLGEIKTVEIWHDNKDGVTAWKLQKVIIICADSHTRYTFLCGKWLSLDCDDGLTWRSMNVLDQRHLETDTLFYNLSQKKLFNDHLWISLFTRPHYSRFTRVQRLWCLAALLFLAMISSAMFYDQPEDKTIQKINLGPLELSYKQFYVGFLSGIIAIVPSMILVIIFKNRKFRGEMTKGYHIPWWFIYLAYVLIFICITVSGTFVFLYSLQWGGSKTLEWMISFDVSLLLSASILEPLKAITLAVCVACIFRNIGSKELIDISMPVPQKNECDDAKDLESVEEVIIISESKYADFPGNEKETAEQIVAKQKAQIDKRMWSKFQSWLWMFIYVVLLAVICSHSDVPTAYRQNEHILNTLKNSTYPNTTSDIYEYLRSTFVRAIYPKWWETEDDGLLRPAYFQRFTLNAYNYRITTSRLRQLRVKGYCNGPAAMMTAVDTCIPSYEKDVEETSNFCKFWHEFNDTEDTGCFDENEEFQYSFLNSRDDNYLEPASDLPYIGQHGTYGSGGYYIDLGPKQSLVTRYLNLLQDHDWIDYRTRVLFLDTVIYNANTRLFSHIKIIFELPTTGSVHMIHEVWSANLYPYVYPEDYIVMALQLIFIFVWCVRFVMYILYIYRSGKKSLWTIHTYVRLLELAFGASAIICCILRINATIAAITSLKKSIGRYVSFELVRVYDAAYQGCLAAVLFIIILDLLKPLEFNYHFFLLISSLKIARKAIMAFMFIIAVEVVAFSALLYLWIGHQHASFKSMLTAIDTLIAVLLAMAKYNTKEFEEPMIKFVFGLYTVTLTLSLVNVFIVLLTTSFNEVQSALEQGTMEFDQRLNDHFWLKVREIAQWIKEKLCLQLERGKQYEIDKLQQSIHHLERLIQTMSKNGLESHRLAAKMMIRMVQLDKDRVQLQCLNVQCNEYAIKYIFGFNKTGETLIILTVPTISCKTAINISCFIVPCLRRDAVRKLRNKNVGWSFMFQTPKTLSLKGCILLEILYSNDGNTPYNAVAVKQELDKSWSKYPAYKIRKGIQATLQYIPYHFVAMDTGIYNPLSDWKPFETYMVSPEGGSVFPSYDPKTKVLFSPDTFSEPCMVSIRTMAGNTTSVLNVVSDIQPQRTVCVTLSDVSKGTPFNTDHMAEFIIVVREGPHEEWEKGNSVLCRMEGGFAFMYRKEKPWTVLEITIKHSEILWVQDTNLISQYGSHMIKAIVMVSQVRDIANNWRQIARMLDIKDDDINTKEDEFICQEEKCFLILEKWLNKSEVTIDMLISLVMSMGFRIIAEQLKQKWKSNAPIKSNEERLSSANVVESNAINNIGPKSRTFLFPALN